MFRRHLGVGGGETGDEVGGEAAVDNLHNHNHVFCQRKRKAEDDIWGTGRQAYQKRSEERSGVWRGA